MHFHHAFVLDSVGYDMTGKAVSMTLVNPWDNLGERFVLTLDEAMKRDVAFAEYARRGTPLTLAYPCCLDAVLRSRACAGMAVEPSADARADKIDQAGALRRRRAQRRGSLLAISEIV